MDKDDMKLIIAAYSEFLQIDQKVQSFTDGVGIGGKFRNLWDLSALIQKYGKVNDIYEIMFILRNEELSVEEKCEMLM